MTNQGGKKVDLEAAYFEKANAEALKRIQTERGSTPVRPSPITGKPMEQITIYGVAVDRCPESGGIWLDKGEMDLLLKAYAEELKSHQQDYTIEDFFLKIFGYGKSDEA